MNTTSISQQTSSPRPRRRLTRTATLILATALACMGTIDQNGPFHVSDGAGRFADVNGTGTYQFDATYTMARTTAGCSMTMTAYIETINGRATLSPSAARNAASRTT
jgi:hypothetical protein